jgi:hypothetical protein
MVPTSLASSLAEHSDKDERIAKILNEANRAMKDDIVTKSQGMPTFLPSDTPTDASSQMSKLYQEELAKIMQQQQKAMSGGAGGLFPGLGSLFGRGGGGGVDNALPPPPPMPLPGATSELQRAMDIYQQELGRLQQNALATAFRTAQNGKDQDKKDLLKVEAVDKELHENGSENKPPTSLSSQSSPSSAGKN